METLWQDLRYAVRVLWKSPAFTLVAVVSLALGIGANTAIFTVANAVFLQPLPIDNPQGVVSLYTIDDKVPGLLPISYPNFEDYRRQQTAFSDMVPVSPVSASIANEGRAATVLSGELVPGRFFRFLGVQAVAGRALMPEDDQAPGANPVVVLSYGVWQQKFAGKQDIVGRDILVNRLPYKVVGVMPQGFKGLNTLTEPAIWAPMCMYTHLLTRPEAYKDRRSLYFYVFGRLKDGVTPEQASASLQPISEQLARTFASNQGRALKVLPISEAAINPGIQQLLRQATLLLMVIVGFVLLIACANIASLMLVRARSRAKEFAIRLAVGAGAWRIARQMITESVLLSLFGGLAGLVVARWTRDLLWSFRPPMFSNLSLDLSLDPRVLGFALLLSVGTGVLFGLVPALHAWRKDLSSDLKERTSQVVRDRGPFNTRGLLVAGQCALSVIALIGAALFVTSLRKAQQTDLGFETSRMAVMRVNLGPEGYRKERGQEFFRQVQERVAGIPAVRSASWTGVHPLSAGGFLRGVYLEGSDASSRPMMLLASPIGTRFFETAGIRILEGRDFAATDREDAPGVLIVNAALAKRLWPGERAVGKRLKLTGESAYREVVGLAADARFLNLNEESRATIYLPIEQEFTPMLTLMVQTVGDPRAVLSAVRAEVQRLDSSLPLGAIYPMDDQIDRSLWAQRLVAGLLAVFGLLGLALASVGVYGLTAYSVSQRVSEIGIRMALGASQPDVLKMIIGESMWRVIPGLLLGMLAALVMARYAGSMLYGIETWHPPAYAGAACILMLVALIACWLPSRRALRIDPVRALRAE